jgi:ribosomal protein S12 methylthiotransferase
MKIYIKRLGCPKNDVDADYLAGMITDNGHSLVENEDEAEAVIVNTCGFILPAKEESINEIVYYEKLKQEGKIDRLYVTGCLSQRYGEELLNEIRGADGILGLGKIDELKELLGDGQKKQPLLKVDSAGGLKYISGRKRYVDNTYPYEYIKIADGCDRYCAYCAIPDIRGRYRSRPEDEIFNEALMLAEKGKKEIILVSQEGSGYGRDLSDGSNIIKLLQKLEEIPKVEWIRLMYLHPEALSDNLIEYMSASNKTLGYFDIPLQHISDNILKRMNRRVTRKDIENRLEKIREGSRDNIIRTTFITGFPGETEDDFLQLHDFVESFGFDRLGVFKYSAEEGTVAYKMKEHVPETIAETRQDVLMSLQQEIAFEKNIALIDSFQKVIIDAVKTDGTAVGRTMGDCPEIDQTVIIRDGSLRSGDIVDVRIIMAEGYDLIAVKNEA